MEKKKAERINSVGKESFTEKIFEKKDGVL